MSAISNEFSNNGAGSATNAFEALSSQDFLQVIFTELQAQNPLEPNDTKDLLNQISTIRSIESDLQLANKLENMLRRSEITSASSLVGKFVTGLNDANTEVLGFVDSVSITREGIRMNLSDGSSIDLSNVQEIVDPALIASTPPPSDEGEETEEPAGPVFDQNGDGLVTTDDLNFVLSHVGETVTPWTSGDIDGNGTVDQADVDAITDELNG